MHILCYGQCSILLSLNNEIELRRTVKSMSFPQIEILTFHLITTALRSAVVIAFLGACVS